MTFKMSKRINTIILILTSHFGLMFSQTHPVIINKPRRFEPEIKFYQNYWPRRVFEFEDFSSEPIDQQVAIPVDIRSRSNATRNEMDMVQYPSNHQLVKQRSQVKLEKLKRNSEKNQTPNEKWLLIPNQPTLVEHGSLRKGTEKQNCIKKCFDPNCEVKCLGLRSSAGCSGISCKASTRGGDSTSLCTGSECKSMCYKEACVSGCDGEACRVGCQGKKCHSVAHGPSAGSRCQSSWCFAYSKGKSVKARCQGKECEAHCLGRNCDAKCNGENCVAMCSGLDCMAACKGPGCTHIIDKKADPQALSSGSDYSSETDSTSENFSKDLYSKETVSDSKKVGNTNKPDVSEGSKDGYFGNKFAAQLKTNEYSFESSEEDGKKKYSLRYSVGSEVGKRLSGYLQNKIGLLRDSSLLSLLPKLV